MGSVLIYFSTLGKISLTKRSPEFLSLGGIAGFMNPAEYNERATVSHHRSNLITTQCVGDMDTDTDRITGLDLLGIYGFKSLIDNYRTPMLFRRSSCEHIQPTGGDAPTPKATSLGLTR